MDLNELIRMIEKNWQKNYEKEKYVRLGEKDFYQGKREALKELLVALKIF